MNFFDPELGAVLDFGHTCTVGISLNAKKFFFP
jgi:hypothetical protein